MGHEKKRVFLLFTYIPLVGAFAHNHSLLTFVADTVQDNNSIPSTSYTIVLLRRLRADFRNNTSMRWCYLLCASSM